MAAKKRGPKGPMTNEHKAALARGTHRRSGRSGLPRSVALLQAQAGTQAHGRFDQQAARRDRRRTCRRRSVERAETRPGTPQPDRRVGLAWSRASTRRRSRMRSSASPRDTANARASRTRRGARSASKPACSSGPASPARPESLATLLTDSLVSASFETSFCLLGSRISAIWSRQFALSTSEHDVIESGRRPCRDCAAIEKDRTPRRATRPIRRGRLRATIGNPSVRPMPSWHFVARSDRPHRGSSRSARVPAEPAG